MAFEAELVLQCPDDRLDALPQPVREVPELLLVLAGWADQGQASSLARVGGQADSAASEPYTCSALIQTIPSSTATLQPAPLSNLVNDMSPPGRKMCR